jgi:hypothetical protein
MATPDSDDRELTRLVNALVTEASMTREVADITADGKKNRTVFGV